MEIPGGMVDNDVTQRKGNIETANLPGKDFKNLRENHVGTNK
jgi:hypothetical protein